jgi:hypothetical protein
METALLGIALPNVLQKLKEMLIREGFLVQTVRTGNPVIVAYQEKRWYRRPKQVVFEISSVDRNLTRIDITAILNYKKNSRHAEEIIEENLASAIYSNFKSLIKSHYGI